MAEQIEERVFLAVQDGRGRFLLGLRGPKCGNPFTWGLIGGSIDAGETPIEALTREVKEETGMSLPNWPVGLFSLAFTEHYNDRVCHFYHAYVDDTSRNRPQKTKEFTEYRWVWPIEEGWFMRPDLHYSAALMCWGIRNKKFT